MNSNKKGMIITSIIMIVLICVAFTSKSFQNDTFYTIKVGKSILKYGIDMKDHFSWHRLPYTYPHWLYDILIYKIYSKYNFGGLYGFTIITFIITGLTFYFVNLKLNKSYFLSLLFSILASIMLAHYATARAQLLTYLLFILEIYFIEKLLHSGSKKYIIFLLLDCLLIANLHAAVWPFYFILMLPYLFEELIYIISTKIKYNPSKTIFNKKLIIENNKNIKYLLIVFIISLFIGILSPVFPEPYTYFIKISLGDTMKYIHEHKPLVLIENAFVIGYLLILLIPLILTKVKVKLTDITMMSGLLIMSFMSVRHISFLAIIGIFYLCRLICNIGKINSKNPLDFELPIIGSLIVLITVIITSSIVYNINEKKEYIDSNTYPVKMVDYIYKELDTNKIKLYNEYDFGSYLIYRNLKVFIDSRSDLYTKPFNKKTDIFDESMNISKNYGRVFNKYDITHILIYNDTKDYLDEILNASSNFKLIKKDGRFSLYEYLNKEDE